MYFIDIFKGVHFNDWKKIMFYTYLICLNEMYAFDEVFCIYTYLFLIQQNLKIIFKILNFKFVIFIEYINENYLLIKKLKRILNLGGSELIRILVDVRTNIYDKNDIRSGI